jgi:hypothetical protein
VAGHSGADPGRVKDGDAGSRFLQEKCGSEARDAAADHRHVDRGVGIKLRVTRLRCRIHP